MKKIKTIRQAINLKQKDLAFKLGIKHSNYANMENGKYSPGNIKDIEQEAFRMLLPALKAKILDERAKLELLESLLPCNIY